MTGGRVRGMSLRNGVMGKVPFSAVSMERECQKEPFSSAFRNPQNSAEYGNEMLMDSDLGLKTSENVGIQGTVFCSTSWYADGILDTLIEMTQNTVLHFSLNA